MSEQALSTDSKTLGAGKDVANPVGVLRALATLA